nr:uncharacterized protein LOC113800207 [Penaeus vannamei]
MFVEVIVHHTSHGTTSLFCEERTPGYINLCFYETQGNAKNANPTTLPPAPTLPSLRTRRRSNKTLRTSWVPSTLGRQLKMEYLGLRLLSRQVRPEAPEPPSLQRNDTDNLSRTSRTSGPHSEPPRLFLPRMQPARMFAGERDG